MNDFFDSRTNLVKMIDGRFLFPSLTPITSTTEWLNSFQTDDIQVFHHNNETKAENDTNTIISSLSYGRTESFQTNQLLSQNYFNIKNLHQQDQTSLKNNDICINRDSIHSEKHACEKNVNKSPSFFTPWNQKVSNEQKLLDIIIDPIKLNFLPKELWLSSQISIGSLIQSFFKARSTKTLRFEHKLWNALVLSQNYPELIPILGIFWVSHQLIKVNRDVFGNLINVTKPAAALFNNQGSFLTHGFIEVSKEEAIENGLPPEYCTDIDESIIRLFKHSIGLLTAKSKKEDVLMCRWSK